LVGFNDLKFLHPDIAEQADGWDPTTVTAKSGQKKSWKCLLGHNWDAVVANRTPPTNSGCPVCVEKGYNPGKFAWFYLMQRPGEQQLGITNNIEQRDREHGSKGWILLDHAGPRCGREILDLETTFKQWLKTSVGVVKGTTENWATTSMEVQSLAELKAKSGIETDLF